MVNHGKVSNCKKIEKYFRVWINKIIALNPIIHIFDEKSIK